MPYIRKIDDRWTFRDSDTKEYTHSYHAYPAMMIPQIARTLIEEYSPKGELKTIFDPYMGSGTTLVEASIKGINSIGTDLNPLARMMSEVKTTHYDEDTIKNLFNEISFQLSFYHPFSDSNLKSLYHGGQILSRYAKIMLDKTQK